MKFQDIQIPDLTLRMQFVEAWFDGRYDDALAIIKHNAQLNTKAFTADVMNFVGNIFLTIENFYYEDFTNALQLELDRFNKAINDFVNRKDWVASTPYVVGNTVVYNEEIYLCILNNIGVTPVDGNTWVKLGLKGAQGADGIQAQMQYEWTPATDYVKNDIVAYGEYLWACVRPNKNQEPMAESAYWVEFLKMPRTMLIVSETMPIKLYDGLIWFEITEPTGTVPNKYKLTVKRYVQANDSFDILYLITRVENVEGIQLGLGPEIIVAVPTGTEVTATKAGENPIRAISVDGKATLYIPRYGLWRVEDYLGYSKEVNVDEARQYEIALP